MLKAPSSKEIAAGPAYFRPTSKKRIFVITITSRAQRRSSSPPKIEGMKAVHVYQSKYSPRSLGKISEERRRNPRGERAAVFLTFDFQGGEDVKPDKNGILNYEMWSQGEYGPHVGHRTERKPLRRSVGHLPLPTGSAQMTSPSPSRA